MLRVNKSLTIVQPQFYDFFQLEDMRQRVVI